MVSSFQIVVTFGFILLWYILYSFMGGFRRNSSTTDFSPEVQALSNEVRLLRKLLDFENRELAQIREKLKAQETEIERFSHKKISSDHDRSWKEPIPVLVFACNRAGAVTNHVNKLLKYRPSQERFPVIVTQDCDNEEVRKAVEAFGDQVSYIKHVSGEKANITIPANHKMYTAYYRIARHYKLALEHVFKEKGYTSVIITEDDLDIAPDFFEYFSATRYLLDSDPLLWCVSAWNDNGKMGNIDNSAYDKLYRSDFFSGLGWMMSSKTWEELGPIWPTGFWDDWMRDPARRKGRQCIRPEISRTGMTLEGKVGASKGQFFTKHLARIMVNRNPVKFTLTNLDYLLQANYDPWFEKEVFEKSERIDINAVGDYAADLKNKRTSIRVEYSGNIDYIQKADKLLIMHDFKAGVPRTAYKGIVSCFVNGVRVYLAPDRTIINGYNPSWEVPPRFGE